MGDPFVTLDLHGYTQAEAERVVERALRTASPTTYQLRLVHGFHRGTSLREMIWERFEYHDRVLRVMNGDNPGITVLVLRELY